ncbi:hypothetical protein [Pseudanabaena sp. FACHB-2040]|uniref:hypothetical protein n=1 Tax=Pseudanabaena sp. FACHB-2040 TaxID=2692859 RepID=UPI00168212FD|nr:hypothetical protein [Pseudanabaena sp. FACHB-2040]MBD2261125.1 hypothetical protein [Pseudanabaena sp. FACHB-2040]
MNGQIVRSHLWLDAAEDRAEAVHNPKLYIGAGLGAALVLGSLLNPITALAALTWGLYSAWLANEANSDQIEAVEDGIIAHLLNERQLREYIAEAGLEQVKWELQIAKARELQLSDAAQALLSGKSRLPLALPPRPQPQAETEAETQRGNIGAATRLGAISTEAEPATPQDEGPQFERSPFLPEALQQQIRAEAEAAAREQSLKSMMQGMHFAQRIYPRRQRTGAAVSDTPEGQIGPAVQAVQGPVQGHFSGPVQGAVQGAAEVDPAEVALFEETVQAFTPLPLDASEGVTQEAIREALRLGKSQNWIVGNLFGIRSKSSRDYQEAVEIIKAIRGA